MNKKLLITLFFLVMLFGFMKVSALDTGFTNEIKLLEVDNCNALFGDPNTTGQPAYYLQKVLDIMRFVGIILLIVLTVVDFFKALIADDKEMVKPLVGKTVKRIFFAIMLFFLPIIADVLLSWLGAYGTCKIK